MLRTVYGHEGGSGMGLGHVKNIMESERDWSSGMCRYAAICLAFHADYKGIVRVSQYDLAGEMEVSVRTVARALEDLCEAGVFAKLRHGRYGVRYGASERRS
jgi:hypothetical protein